MRKIESYLLFSVSTGLGLISSMLIYNYICTNSYDYLFSVEFMINTQIPIISKLLNLLFIYLSIDLLINNINIKKDALYHHFLIFILIFLNKYYKIADGIYTLCLLNEISSIFYSISYMSKHIIFKLLFAITFFMFRICLLTKINISLILNLNLINFSIEHYALGIIFLLLTILNYYWFWLIICKAIKK